MSKVIQTRMKPPARSSSSPAPHSFKSRPYAALSTRDENEAEDLEAQRDSAGQLGHHFGTISVSADWLPRIQPKLQLGPVGDRYEQEADGVAAQVVRGLHAPAGGQRSEVPSVQRLPAATSTTTVAPEVEAGIRRARGGGQPLLGPVRGPMERAFGADFSGVRLHTDAQSDRLNQSVGARAFTSGRHIFFCHGAYDPATHRGQVLLAHELTHSLQQTGGDLSNAREAGTAESIIGYGQNDSRKPYRYATCEHVSVTGKVQIQRNGPCRTYQECLEKAIDKLKGVGFGRSTGMEKYDKEFWEKKGYEVEPGSWFPWKSAKLDYKLVLKPGKKPSDAIDALFSKRNEWSIDCAEFVQIAHMYAQRWTLRDDFDRKLSEVKIELKPHGSTTMSQPHARFVRDEPNVNMRNQLANDMEVERERDVEDLLFTAPIGSRIAWTNLAAKPNSSFRHHNAIKLGRNLYAQHGIKKENGDNRLTRQEIEEHLAKDALGSGWKDKNEKQRQSYIEQKIFISQLEIYRMS
jgi:hypothetical protein